ncbi:MAG: AAA family ATPase [Candidatus Altiarchaeales archaeon]|nr:AAA family ATPase [Candidatus Altiarchaeales archaeon]
MERASSGIPGLDELLDGGIPRGHSVLVTGGCGTGKTVLSLQYLYHGASRGEPSLYVTFEESKKKIRAQMKAFNWDVEVLEEKGLFEIYAVDTEDLDEALSKVKEKTEKQNTKRLVIDSLTTMMEHGVVYTSQISKDMSQAVSSTIFTRRNQSLTRRDIYQAIGFINNLNTTCILVSEVGEQSKYLSRDTISEFASDGVILLENSTVLGGLERLLSVRKMRGSAIKMDILPMSFRETGIEVSSTETQTSKWAKHRHKK